MTDCPGFGIETYGFYALGSLSGSECEEIEQHLLAECETCTRELHRAVELWTSVGMATPDSRPPASLRSNVVAAVKPAKSRPWTSFPVWATAALSFLVGVGALKLSESISHAPQPLPTVVTSSRIAPRPEPARPDAILETIPEPPGIETHKVNPLQGFEGTQTQIVTGLQSDLLRERARTAQMERDLAQQVELAAQAKKEAQDAERKYLAIAESPRQPAPQSNDASQARAVDTLTTRVRQLEDQVTQYRVLLDTQTKRLDQSMQLASLVSTPGLRIIELRGTEKGTSAQGQALIVPGREVAFYASRLPALPANRTYQLWIMRKTGQAVTSAGLLTPNASGAASLQVTNQALLSGVTAFAVTDEPAGGSAQPTGHKWLIGS